MSCPSRPDGACQADTVGLLRSYVGVSGRYMHQPCFIPCTFHALEYCHARHVLNRHDALVTRSASSHVVMSFSGNLAT
jgi:hypothetical protein